MKDIEVALINQPGTLALLGETLGKYKISLEGGGVFSSGATTVAHFLVNEPELAKDCLSAVGIEVSKIHEVLILKLRQDVPGQLGLICRRLADVGVNIHTQYSDHSNQLILVVDDPVKGRVVADKWMNEWWG